MSEISDKSIKKLSEAIVENNEIIGDINNLIKEMKAVKDINDEVYDKYKKSSEDLTEDLDEIIEVIESCKQEDDPNFKSFDSKKKIAKSNSEKSKKQLMDALSKLEKLLIKSKDTEGKKKKGILKIGSKKHDQDKGNKKTENDKSKDGDGLSLKSGAGSSIVEDIDDVNDDFEDNDETKIQDINEDNKVKSENENEDKDSKGSKEKKKGKKDKAEDIDKKGSKNKDKKKKEKVNDIQSEVSSIVGDDENIDEQEKDNADKTKKKKKGIFVDKIKKDKDKDKTKKTSDVESIGSRNDTEFVDDIDGDKNKTGKSISDSEDKKEALEDDKKKKKKKDDSKSVDNKSIDEKKENHETKEKRSISKRSKSKTSSDQDSLGDKKEISKDSNKKMKDKKTKKSEEVDKNAEDKNEKDEKDKEKKDKKKNKEEDNKSIDEKSDKGKKDKKKKNLETKENPDNSKVKDIDSDNEMRTPSLRTQESLKSETDYDEDFNSEEENVDDSIVVKEAAKVESKMLEDSMKPTTSLKRQQYVDSEEKNTSKLERELMASTTFKAIDSSYVVIKAFEGEGEDDLSVDIGEELTVLEFNDDGWWLVKNKNGDEGFVQEEYLKPIHESKNLWDLHDNNEISDHMVEAKDSKMISEECHDNDGTHLWDQIQQSMKEQSNATQKGLSDVLKSFGSLPTGFRFSTLAIWSKKNTIECSMKAYLYPKLSESDLSFKDLQYDTVEKKIRPRSVRIQRTIQIVKAIQMPVTSEKFVVKSRHIRMCLFNGEKAISNIHMMRATVNEKDTKTWNFNSKIMDSTTSLDYYEIFVKSNHSTTELSILLEFCMLGFKSKYISGAEDVDTTHKKSSTVKINEEFNDEELTEFSIGWTKIPLYEENGQLITNKNGDYELFGGTPYEVGLEVDPNIGRTASGGKFKSLLKENKQPQISVRLSLPNKENKDLIETLSDIIIGSTLNLTNLSYYRRILSDELMSRRQNITSAEPIYSPFLVSFLEIADHSDMLDTMRIIWNDKMKSMKNADKKDYVKMNKVFKDTFMEYIYPLSKITSFLPSNWARQEIEQTRAVKIKEFVQRVKSDKLSVLLSGDYSYSPLSFEELSYKVVSKYSKAI